VGAIGGPNRAIIGNGLAWFGADVHNRHIVRLDPKNRSVYHAMSQQSITPLANDSPPPRFLPVLLILFVGSGCAALIYEIVWFQLLQFVIGSSAISLGVLLGTFMGGMCLGSLAMPRLLSKQRHPLRVYAALELAIGIIGVAIQVGMPTIDSLYMAFVGYGLASILLRAAVCALCLLPPTILMGATLPAIARWVETTPQGISWLGFFYGGNIVGAVIGCLTAGFYLLRLYDMATATFVAAGINAAVAFLAFVLALLAPRRVGEDEVPQAPILAQPGSWSVYIVIALSGACALGAEVIWTRLLSLLLGATVYTFSIILAVFLIGLGVGSSIGSYVARGAARPRLALGCCQLLLVGAIAWAAFVIAESLPYWPIDPYKTISPWANYQLDLVRCMWAILPAACLWGASFPLALAAVAARGQDAGKLVGGVYAANTIGAIVGAVGCSMLLIGWLGTQDSQRVLLILSAAAALVMLVPQLWPFPRGRWFVPGNAVVLIGTVGLAALLAFSLPAVPWEMIAFGRSITLYHGQQEVHYVGEGLTSSVAVTQTKSGARNFCVSGKVEASTEPQDMRLQRMLGHIPALIQPKTRSVLIVGCGAGVTAGSFVLYPDIKRIVICEIEPLVPQVVAKYFAEQNYNVVNDPRVEIVYDDARHYVLTTDEKFDIITSDPIHPWVKGAATLYTKEYYELCKKRLNPGGVITQWVPLYDSTLPVVKSELATFFEAFPYGTIWSNEKAGEGYDVVMLGQFEATTIDVDEIQQRLDSAAYQAVAKSLTDIGFTSTVSLFMTYAGQAADMKHFLLDAEINSDSNLRLQYLAGMEHTAPQSNLILNQMVLQAQYPDRMFVGMGQYNTALRWAVRQRLRPK
jgi:spermidine synthase